MKERMQAAVERLEAELEFRMGILDILESWDAANAANYLLISKLISRISLLRWAYAL